jgi:hypothetical protein
MLYACDVHGWRPIAVSTKVAALAALVAIDAVKIVVTIDWRRSLAEAVESAGGTLVVIRQSTTPRVADLNDALKDLVTAGRLNHGEVASLLLAAGIPPPGCPPDPNQRPQRLA